MAELKKDFIDNFKANQARKRKHRQHPTTAENTAVLETMETSVPPADYVPFLIVANLSKLQEIAEYHRQPIAEPLTTLLLFLRPFANCESLSTRVLYQTMAANNDSEGIITLTEIKNVYDSLFSNYNEPPYHGCDFKEYLTLTLIGYWYLCPLLSGEHLGWRQSFLDYLSENFNKGKSGGRDIYDSLIARVDDHREYFSLTDGILEAYASLSNYTGIEL